MKSSTSWWPSLTTSWWPSLTTSWWPSLTTSWWPLLIILVLFSTDVDGYSRTNIPLIYQHRRLEKICPETGGKLQVSLKTSVSVFMFSTQMMDIDLFTCHLELVVNSASYGFSVFIEEMTMEESNRTGCDEDYIQFGRDILFVTSHKSKHYCGVVEPPVPKVAKEGIGVSFPATPLDKRIYTEESDKEMDLWVRVTVPPLGARPKTFTLVITPFKKYCGQNDLYYRQCRYSTKCIRKELFCDGIVNCAWPYSEPADEVNCKETPATTPPPKTELRVSWDTKTSLTAALLILLLLTILCCGFWKLKDRVEKQRGSTIATSSSMDDGGQSLSHLDSIHPMLRVAHPTPDQFHPTCPPLNPPSLHPPPLHPPSLHPPSLHPPPINPPSYSEACLPSPSTISPPIPPKYQRSYLSRCDDRQA